MCIFNGCIESGVPIVAEMAQLPYLVEQTQREIGEKKQQLRLLRLEREQQFWIHFKVVCVSLCMAMPMDDCQVFSSHYTLLTACAQ